ncbi:MAG: NERD domain-containing protein kinase family protein, partial [Shewanella sp.]
IIDIGVCDTLPQAIEIIPEAVIDHHYRLERLITEAPHSQLWQARHLQGQYDCGLSVYDNVAALWPMLSSLYRSLSKIYHPNIEKVLAFGQLPESESLFIARAWEQGEAIDEVVALSTPKPHLARVWFMQLLNALQYLHRLDIYHGAICPKNIICHGEKAVLVNFGVGLDIAASFYAKQYADPTLWSLEGEAERDLFGLVASFVDALTPVALKGELTQRGLINALQAFDQHTLGEGVLAACLAVLRFEFTLDPKLSYAAQFGLD